MQERRKLRSDAPLDALKLYLSRLISESKLRAAVVSDGDGLLIGGVGEGVDLEALAALRQGPEVASEMLRYAGTTLYLVTQGRAQVGLERAKQAVGRILSLGAT